MQQEGQHRRQAAHQGIRIEQVEEFSPELHIPIDGNPRRYWQKPPRVRARHRLPRKCTNPIKRAISGWHLCCGTRWRPRAKSTHQQQEQRQVKTAEQGSIQCGNAANVAPLPQQPHLVAIQCGPMVLRRRGVRVIFAQEWQQHATRNRTLPTQKKPVYKTATKINQTVLSSISALLLTLAFETFYLGNDMAFHANRDENLPPSCSLFSTQALTP